MKNNQIKSVRDTYRPIEELQFLLRIEAIPLTETIVKRAVENFIEAAHFIENAPSSAFYDKDIEHFNMYMWRIREHAFDIMNSWLKRHNNAVSQDDLVYKSCVSIIEAIRLVAIETGTPIQPKPDDEIFKQKKEFRDYMVGDNIENRLSKAKKIQAKRKKKQRLLEILEIVFPDIPEEFPTYEEFLLEFGKIIGRTLYYESINEYVDLKKPKFKHEKYN